MTASDYGTFDRAFRRVLCAYPVRSKVQTAEVEALSRTYFRVLADAPLGDVLAAGKACLGTCKRFPTVAEWVAAIPTPPRAAEAADVRVMATTERDEYVRAEGLRYEDMPCGCGACFQADVSDRPLRFVPDEVNGVLDRAIDAVRNRVVVTGHWAHGPELGRWYDARAAFYASAPRRTPIARALLVLVGPEREPGCDDD
jgi:hypothetical protein